MEQILILRMLSSPGETEVRFMTMQKTMSK